MSAERARVWIARAGRRGEDEETGLDSGRVIIGFRPFPDLTQFSSVDELVAFHQGTIEPGAPERRSRNLGQQLWAFRERIQTDDVVVLPLKTRPGQLAIGRVTGPYRFQDVGGGEKRHTRSVEWTHPDLPRTAFQQDLLYSFGSFITVCRIQRNDAERRVEAVLRGEPDPGPSGADVVSPDVVNGDAEGALTRLDLMQAAEDEITACIRARFPDHDLARLVETILQAEGFYTRRSTPGPDGGADVLCGSGPLGLDQPFLCVQVKATQGTTDVKVFRELAGTMAAFKATQGLLASWGGFTQGVVREARQETFKIRLWDQSDLVKAVYRTYDRLDAQIQAELPLKRIWMLVHEDEEGDE